VTVSLVFFKRENERKNGLTRLGTKKQKTQKDTNEVYRSLMKLAILGLSGVLLLTGCGSSLSVEEQTRLIQYENCLASELELWKFVAQDTSPSSMYEFWIEKHKDGGTLSDGFVEYCAFRVP